MEELQRIDLDQPTGTMMSMEERPMSTTSHTGKTKVGTILIVVAVVLGVGSGWYVAQKRLLLAGGDSMTAETMAQNPTDASTVKVGDAYGNADEKTFRDSAEGVLMVGGIEGEGSHRLERGTNKSQWVYLTSSVVDLDNFKGHKVTVWGETFQGKKAGWLMDVGRLKVVELNAKPVDTGAEQEE